MSDSSSPASPPVPLAAGVLLRQVACSHAARMAREGRLSAAEALLKALLPSLPPDDPASLDLLARIRAQQGALRDAEALWLEVLRLDPGHSGALAALARIRRPQRRPFWLQPLALTLAALAALLGFGLAACAVIKHQNRVALQVQEAVTLQQTAQGRLLAQQIEVLAGQVRQVEAGQTAAARGQAEVSVRIAALDSSLQTAAQQQHSLGEQQQAAALQLEALVRTQAAGEQSSRERVTAFARQIDAALTQTETRLIRQLAPPAPPVCPSLSGLEVAIKGVTPVPRRDGFDLRFDEGLFDQGVLFRLGAKPLLAKVARALARTQLKLTVEVVGFAEAETRLVLWSRYRSDEALAFSRAVAVADYLGQLGLFPPGRLKALVGTPVPRPFPGDSPDLRRSQRTVVLRVFFHEAD